MDFICPHECSYRTSSGYCGSTGGYETCQYRQLHVDAKPFGNGIDVCPVCGKPSTIGKPQTNADRIRAMTDEELADLYMKAIEDEEYPGWWGNRMGLLAWLKQEAKT